VEGRSAQRATLAFNDAITRRDLAALSRLMTDDHAFIDSDDTVVSGKDEVLKAWKGFFAAFPDYRNVWSSVTSADGVLIAVGRSVCASEPRLDGPAIWTAKTRGERVAEWRVYDDTPENRTRLSLQRPAPPAV
jgi:ketosteroid isomerase-like protein